MESFKGLFISIYINFMLLVFGYSSMQFLLGRMHWIWFGNMFSYAVGLGYFALIYLIATPRTTKNMWLPWGLILIGTTVSITEVMKGDTTYLALGINLLMVLGWYLYTYWATDFSIRNKDSLQVGHLMPNVKLKDLEGNTIELKNFFNKPAIFLFYRGNWCPFCTAQIKELAKAYQQIEAAGSALVFISPQSIGHTQNLAKQFQIPAIFLRDENLEAAKQLQLFHEKGTPRGLEILGFGSDNILPTLIITDHKGVIRFADLTDNYRLRPEPKVYLELLQKI